MSDKARIAAKIKALLAKTTEAGATEEEALAAATKAAELMRDYQVSLSETEILSDGFEELWIDHYIQEFRIPYEQIANAIAALTGTQAMLRRQLNKKYVSFFGLRGDVEFASWLCKALGDFVVAGSHQHVLERKIAMPLHQKADIRLWQKSYFAGAAMRITDRIYALKREQDAALKRKAGGSRDLIIAKQAIVSAEMARQGIELQSARRSRVDVEQHSYTAGLARGDQASFSRPVNGGRDTRMLR